MRARLNTKIWKKLKTKLKGKITEQALRNRISLTGKQYGVTLNAAAHLTAQTYGFSVWRYLNNEDKASLRSLKIEKVRIIQKIPRKEKIITIAKYPTDDKLLEAHLKEINRTYTYKCYTATFVLCRKVLENLIIKILRRRYPEDRKEHREKYFDFNRGRSLDFGVLLKNLRDSSKDFFGPERKLIERICDLASGFKETADEMTHSLFHIAMKKEIDERNFQYILDLIQELERRMN